MKKQYITLIICLLFSYSHAQNNLKKEIAQRIKTYLQKDSNITDYYAITDEGFFVFASHDEKENNNPELSFLFDIDSKPTTELFNEKDSTDKPFSGLKVAIDPVGIGGNMAEIERRIAYTKDSNKEIDLSALNLVTAKNLKNWLEEKGATVMLTHETVGQSVYKKSYWDWEEDYLNKIDTKESYEILKKAITKLIKSPNALYKKATQFIIEFASTPPETKQLVIRKLLFYLIYNKLDIIARAQKINQFNPHLTLVILYNHTENHNINDSSTCFIPGAFLNGELDELEWRQEFFRLATNNIIEESLNLATKINGALQKYCQIKPNEKTIINTIPVSNGIYCRNLILTRLVNSPICYTLPTYIQLKEELTDEWAESMGFPYFQAIGAYLHNKGKNEKHTKN